MQLRFPSQIPDVQLTTLKKLVWLSFLVSFAAFLARNDVRVFNSDYLYLPALYKDLFECGGRLSDWYLPPAPYFFPDMALYFLVNFLIKNWALSYTIAGACQAFLFLFGWVILAKAMRPLEPKISRSEILAPLIFSLILTLDTIEPVFNSLAVQPFILSAHFGLAVATPYFLGLALFFGRRTQLSPSTICILATTFVLCGLFCMSDILFVVVVAGPLLVALAIQVFRDRSYFRSILIFGFAVLEGSAAGHLANKAFVSHPIAPRYSSLAEASMTSRSLHAVVDWFGMSLREKPIFALIVVLAIGVNLTIAARSLWSKHTPSVQEAGPIFISTFFSASVIMTIAAVVLTGNFENHHSSRYLMPLVMCLVCTIPLLLPHAVRTKRKMNLLAVLLCFLILGLASPSLAIIGQLKRYLAYYPAEVSSLDHELQRRHLVTGIGNYWDSKYITMLSRDTVRILQVRPDLAPFFWINSAKWYEKGQPQFVLIDTSAYAITPPMYRLSESFVRGQFGDPEERFTVSGKVVLVYNRTSDSAFKDLLRK